MNYGDDWEARGGGGVADRGLAIIGVPAKDIVGEALARYGVHTLVSFKRAGGIWKMSVPPAGSSTSGRSRKSANAWQSLQ